MNNKGFTLIELLAVIVVLLLITLIAIPNIASSFERNKNKINELKINTIKSAGSIYASRYKKKFQNDGYEKFLKEECGISIQMLLDTDLITDAELKDSEGNYLKYNGNEIDEYLVFYEYDEINNTPTGKYIIKISSSQCQINLN